jgi:hypothetical protein
MTCVSTQAFSLIAKPGADHASQDRDYLPLLFWCGGHE